MQCSVYKKIKNINGTIPVLEKKGLFKAGLNINKTSDCPILDECGNIIGHAYLNMIDYNGDGGLYKRICTLNFDFLNGGRFDIPLNVNEAGLASGIFIFQNKLLLQYIINGTETNNVTPNPFFGKKYLINVSVNNFIAKFRVTQMN